MTLLMWLPGALVGLGIVLILAHCWPAPVRLDAALARLDAATRTSSDKQQRPPLLMRAGQALAGYAPRMGLRLPQKDLRLLATSAERFLLTKLASTVGGAALALVWAAMLTAAGIPLPWQLAALGVLAVAALAFFLPDVALRRQANHARQVFRACLTAYLDLVALERAAGAGPTEALEIAARVAPSWPFARLAAALAQARHGTTTAWQELATLGQQLGVAELSDLADIAALAGNEGATILDTLQRKATSLRRQQLAVEHAHANARTTTMAVPMALCGFAFLLLLAFPALARMAGS